MWTQLVCRRITEHACLLNLFVFWKWYPFTPVGLGCSAIYLLSTKVFCGLLTHPSIDKEEIMGDFFVCVFLCELPFNTTNCFAITNISWRSWWHSCCVFGQFGRRKRSWQKSLPGVCYIKVWSIVLCRRITKRENLKEMKVTEDITIRCRFNDFNTRAVNVKWKNLSNYRRITIIFLFLL